MVEEFGHMNNQMIKDAKWLSDKMHGSRINGNGKIDLGWVETARLESIVHTLNRSAYNPDERLREALEEARPYVQSLITLGEMEPKYPDEVAMNRHKALLTKIDSALSPLLQGDD